MEFQFLSLTADQLGRFARLKTERELASHGPLAFGQDVPLHDHQEPALYVVDGLAELADGNGTQRALGKDATANAVLVPAGKRHGWRGLREATRIEHCFGNGAVQAVVC